MLTSGCKKVPWKLIVDGIILTLIMKKNKPAPLGCRY